MRILHTSDWHLGRSFHREDLLSHQGVWADHLMAMVVAERVDVVVVAGDVYDRALPSVDAVRLADDVLARLVATGARVIVTSGNHDSAMRLGFGSRIFDSAGLHVRTDAAGVGTPVIVEDQHGPVRFYPLPWLEPEAMRTAWGLPVRSHEASLGEAMRRVRADLTNVHDARSVVIAHAFVAGSQPTDSERDISVGGVDRVPTTVFDGVDYVALGHLHGAQQPREGMAYSGSPLAYSFSEADHIKGSWLVELDAQGVSNTEFIPTPAPRRLSRLSGTLEQLLTDPTLSAVEQDWVEVTLHDVPRPARPMDRLRRRFPGALVLRFAGDGGAAGPAPQAASAQARVTDVAEEFVLAMRGVEATEAERALLQRASDACCADPEADMLVSEAG